MSSLVFKKPQQNGFTLIEALVAMIVIAVGLLGIAGTLALALNNTSISRNRSLAAIAADGLAAMMRANANFYYDAAAATGYSASYWQSPTGVPSGKAITVVCKTKNSTTGYCTEVTIGDATLNAQVTSACVNSTTNTSCSTTAMAAYDLQQWGKSVADLLPGGNGSVTCTLVAGSPIYCRISVNWDENALVLNQVIAGGGTQTYTMVVEP